MLNLLFCLSLLVSPVGQAPLHPETFQPAPVRLNGVWDINKDLSTKPMATAGERGGEGDRGGSGGGGRSGGMGGGRGGGMRGGGGGGRGNADDMRKVRDLMQELGQSPSRLTIVSKSDAVNISDPEGVIRRFAVDGKTEKVAINGSPIEVKSKWDGEVLSQEFKVGSAKFIRAIETTVEGHQLVITVTPKGDAGGVAGPTFLRFVYDRSQLQ